MLRLSSLSYRWHTEGDTLAWTPPEGSECPVQKPTDMRNSYNLTGHLSLVQYVVLNHLKVVPVVCIQHST